MNPHRLAKTHTDRRRQRHRKKNKQTKKPQTNKHKKPRTDRHRDNCRETGTNKQSDKYNLDYEQRETNTQTETMTRKSEWKLTTT